MNRTPVTLLNSKVLNELENGHEDLTVNKTTQNEKMKARSGTGKLIQERETSYDPMDIANSTSLGHLIPLTCGHNGSLKIHEMEFYEYHLKNSRLLDK